MLINALRPHAVRISGPFIKVLLRALLVLFGLTVIWSLARFVVVTITTGAVSLTTMILPVFMIVYFVFGFLIDKKQPGHTIAFLFILMALSAAVSIVIVAVYVLEGLPSLKDSPQFSSVVLVLGHTVWLPAVVTPAILMPLYFPDGRLLSPRWRLLVIFYLCSIAWSIITVALRPWPWPEWGIYEARAYNGIPGSEPFFETVGTFFNIFTVPVPLLALLSIFLRYRRADSIARAKLKWPIFATLCIVILGAVYLASPSLLAWDERNDYPITWGLTMLFPVSIGIAILRHQLWDIDLMINRTLVYGTLSALTVGAYVAIVALFRMLFQPETDNGAGLIAAALIALLFQPLRDWLQRRVKRLLYGQRDDPAAVLTRLAHHLETAESPDAILPNLVQTIAHTLKIPHVAIWLSSDPGRSKPTAEWGKASEWLHTIPLTYQQETIGQLVVAARRPRERFNHHEQQLLATIAALTSTTVRAVQLSEELRASRRRIVTAREDERRRLRRDLHDDLGPQLASQALGLEAVAQLMPDRPEKALDILDSLKRQAEDAIRDIRRLVYDLRPPALDDLGLIGALRQSAARYENGVLRFNLDAPPNMPELPAAVESALYRITQEAITNVMRHAGATSCSVRLFCTDGHVNVEVHDNGSGFSLESPSGIGLQAMRERAAELNGHFHLLSMPGWGTLVQAALPIEINHE